MGFRKSRCCASHAMSAAHSLHDSGVDQFKYLPIIQTMLPNLCYGKLFFWKLDGQLWATVFERNQFTPSTSQYFPRLDFRLYHRWFLRPKHNFSAFSSSIYFLLSLWNLLYVVIFKQLNVCTAVLCTIFGQHRTQFPLRKGAYFQRWRRMLSISSFFVVCQ